MAKCKICKTNIPDGTEYCSSCQEKGNIKSNESYLDSLLDSVKNPVTAAEGIYKKKSGTNPLNSDEINTKSAFDKAKAQDMPEDDLFEDDIYNLDIEDIEDFGRFDMEDDLDGLQRDTIVKDEELFGQDLSELFGNPVPSEATLVQEAAARSDYGTSEAAQPSQERQEEPSPYGAEELPDTGSEEGAVSLNNATDSFTQDEIAKTQEEEEAKKKEAKEKEAIEEEAKEKEAKEKEAKEKEAKEKEAIEKKAIEEETIEKKAIEEETIEKKAIEKETKEEETGEEIGEDDFDPDLNELLNSLELQSASSDKTASEREKEAEAPAVKAENENKAAVSETEDFEQVEPEDDFLSLLNQIASDDPVAGDVKAINDLLRGKPADDRNKTPSDVGEVFSDALKVVSSLNDPTLEELEALDKIPDAKEAKKKKQKKQKVQKEKKGSKKGAKKRQPADGGPEKPKKGLLKRIFGNVEDENASKKKKQPKKPLTEEAAAAAEKPQRGKAAKGKKGAPSEDTEIEEFPEGRRGKGKPDKADDKKEDKEDKKEKRKKTKEVIQVIDEIDEDEGRINRLGASVVFIFFGLLAVLLLAGTNVVSYTLSIEHATNYFERQKYTQAYNEVYGIDIKDEDIEIYDKIMTVMFVNKQLNSYNNYYSIQKYPQALDSLLKGLKRYDKYIELATMLGIKTDLDYVRRQILAELKNVFKLSEKEAIKIISMDNMEEYSLEVYDVVLEKMNH